MLRQERYLSFVLKYHRRRRYQPCVFRDRCCLRQKVLNLLNVRYIRIFRFRSDDDDYRIYFTVEQNEDGDNVVVVQRVLHADSLKDFFFRSGMGSDSEDRKLGKSRSFWKLIEDGEKAARK